MSLFEKIGSAINNLSLKKGAMLGITNKGMQMSVDRLTLYVATDELDKAKKELKVLKEQTAELEQLMAEYEKISKG